MTDEAEIATVRQGLSLLKQDVEGERAVSRHLLRKLNEMDDRLISLAKSGDRIEESMALLRADLPRIIAEVVGAVLREDAAKRK